MKFVYAFFIPIVFILVGWFANTAWNLPREVSPVAEIKPRPLTKYSFEVLPNTQIPESTIEIGEVIKETPKFNSYLFSYKFDPTLTKSKERKVTGVINIPNGEGKFPLIVMLRGYVDQKIYKSGDGTRRAGEYFAEQGFITVAPDFLGYGGSDTEAYDIFESRFQTYTTSLVLLNSLSSIPNFDKRNISIWGHSNGGHLALAMLEITGKNYPTVLWAPNSQKFPYSIIYYLDEAADEGKLIITKLADFMDSYDAKEYSIRNYFGKINPSTPIEIHQGLADDAIPISWSNSLVKLLEDQKIKVDYFKYKGADHNLNPSWNDVVNESLNFFQKNLK